MRSRGADLERLADRVDNSAVVDFHCSAALDVWLHSIRPHRTFMLLGPRAETAKQRPGRGGRIEYRMFREPNSREALGDVDTGSR